ncbi:MAG TPA: T9SS type A sorting domain-containing protein [Ignavibacteriales bacterium]|nr:T9SS type A sorting domain-containing protein [Ignavibacteriales bacterium]
MQWADSLWKNYSRETYTYDDDGNALIELYEIGENFTSWAEYEKHIFEYDTNGNAVHAESYSWMNGAWIEANGYLGNTFGSYNAQSVDAVYRFIKKPVVGVDEENLYPTVFSLAQNYPNPFNPETKISFSLPQSGKATLKIYDMLGREVAELINGEMEKGSHSVNFNGRNLSSGVYIYRLQSGAFAESKKMALIK